MSGCIVAAILLDSSWIPTEIRSQLDRADAHWVRGLGYSVDFDHDIVDDEDCNKDKGEQS